MSPPSLIPVMTMRAGSAHSLVTSLVTSADRNDTSGLGVRRDRSHALAVPAPWGRTARAPAAMARAGMRLWAASSSAVRPNPGRATTRGSRWWPSSRAGTASRARRPPGRERTTVPAGRPAPHAAGAVVEGLGGLGGSVATVAGGDDAERGVATADDDGAAAEEPAGPVAGDVHPATRRTARTAQRGRRGTGPVSGPARRPPRVRGDGSMPGPRRGSAPESRTPSSGVAQGGTR